MGFRKNEGTNQVFCLNGVIVICGGLAGMENIVEPQQHWTGRYCVVPRIEGEPGGDRDSEQNLEI